MSGTSLLTLKRGATFALTFQLANSDGTPFDPTTAQMACQLRDTQDNLVAVEPVQATGQPGQAYVLQADTTTWPLGVLRCDVEIVVGGLTTYTETFFITIQPAVTHL